MIQKSFLDILPPAVDRQGWPWDIEVDPAVYTTRANWPKISIVTPSYNQGQYIEETIRSILLQNYPNLEYIVIDGGSTDNTVEILEEYAPWITYWVSEKDKGQGDAINKGVDKCTGDIFNWINSDDYLAEKALFHIANAYKSGATIAGNVKNFFEDSGRKEVIPNTRLGFKDFLAYKGSFHQPGIWCDMKAFKANGKIPTNYSYYFDRVFLLKYFMNNSDVVYLDEVLVNFRMHESSKTLTIMKDKNPEMLDYYRHMIASNEFSAYKKEISQMLYHEMIPYSLVIQWEKDNEQKGFVSKLTSYLGILVKYPKCWNNKYYRTIFKKKVIGL